MFAKANERRDQTPGKIPRGRSLVRLSVIQNKYSCDRPWFVLNLKYSLFQQELTFSGNINYGKVLSAILFVLSFSLQFKSKQAYCLFTIHQIFISQIEVDFRTGEGTFDCRVGLSHALVPHPRPVSRRFVAVNLTLFPPRHGRNF